MSLKNKKMRKGVAVATTIWIGLIIGVLLLGFYVFNNVGAIIEYIKLLLGVEYRDEFTEAIKCAYYRCKDGCAVAENSVDSDLLDCSDFCSALPVDFRPGNKVCGWNAKQFPIEVVLEDSVTITDAWWDVVTGDSRNTLFKTDCIVDRGFRYSDHNLIFPEDSECPIKNIGRDGVVYDSCTISANGPFYLWSEDHYWPDACSAGVTCIATIICDDEPSYAKLEKDRGMNNYEFEKDKLYRVDLIDGTISLNYVLKVTNIITGPIRSVGMYINGEDIDEPITPSLVMYEDYYLPIDEGTFHIRLEDVVDTDRVSLGLGYISSIPIKVTVYYPEDRDEWTEEQSFIDDSCWGDPFYIHLSDDSCPAPDCPNPTKCPAPCSQSVYGQSHHNIDGLKLSLLSTSPDTYSISLSHDDKLHFWFKSEDDSLDYTPNGQYFYVYFDADHLDTNGYQMYCRLGKYKKEDGWKEYTIEFGDMLESTDEDWKCEWVDQYSDPLSLAITHIRFSLDGAGDVWFGYIDNLYFTKTTYELEPPEDCADAGGFCDSLSDCTATPGYECYEDPLDCTDYPATCCCVSTLEGCSAQDESDCTARLDCCWGWGPDPEGIEGPSTAGCYGDGDWCCYDATCDAGHDYCYRCPNDALDCWQCVAGSWTANRCEDGTVNYDAACDDKDYRYTDCDLSCHITGITTTTTTTTTTSTTTTTTTLPLGSCDELGGTCLPRGICSIEPDLECVSSSDCTGPNCCCVEVST